MTKSRRDQPGPGSRLRTSSCTACSAVRGRSLSDGRFRTPVGGGSGPPEFVEALAVWSRGPIRLDAPTRVVHGNRLLPFKAVQEIPSAPTTTPGFSPSSASDLLLKPHLSLATPRPVKEWGLMPQ